jgi:HPt (histidine-containing phosphotransfer) domain-containing protein
MAERTDRSNMYHGVQTSPAMSGSSSTPGSGARGTCEPHEAITRLGGLPDLYADVLGRLLDDKSGVVMRLCGAVAAGDAAQIHATAHNLKGLALMCGATSVADVAAELEKSGRVKSISDAPQLIARLNAEMAAARIILAPYR